MFSPQKGFWRGNQWTSRGAGGNHPYLVFFVVDRDVGGSSLKDWINSKEGNALSRHSSDLFSNFDLA